MNNKMKNNNTHSKTIKFMLEAEFDLLSNHANISWSDKIQVIDMLYKNDTLSYRMRMLYIAYKHGSCELKRYVMRYANQAKKIHDNLLTIKDIIDEIKFLESDIEK